MKKDPSEIQHSVIIIADKLHGEETLTRLDRKKMGDDLIDAFNYISHVNNSSNIYAAMAKKQKIEADKNKQLEQERAALEKQREFVEENFNKAEQHLRAIQLGGYAAFFGLWAMTSATTPSVLAAIAALLMLISATTFIIWEVCKATFLTLSIKRHSNIGSSKIEKFITSKTRLINQEQSSTMILAKSRTTFWATSVIPAIIAIMLMAYQFLQVIGAALFK